MCLYPKLIKNRKYVANKKNKGIIPQMKDKRVQIVPVACGKCMECLKKKSKEWQVRLSEDIKHHKDAIFITLTFSNESIRELSKGIKLTGYELDNEIATKATRRFLERWRKKHKRSVRHWLITELGHQGTENIHMHGIIYTDKGTKEIREIWKYGYVWGSDEQKNGYVNEQTINYIIKYVHKQDQKHKEYKPKILTSPGIGKGYVGSHNAKKNKYKKGETKETYTNRAGYKMALPIYFRNKIYTEEERERLWLEKLDKEERYINGQKVDISKGEEGYYNLLKEARKLNKTLGYGDDKINWERKKYERERRIIMQQKRKNKNQ